MPAGNSSSRPGSGRSSGRSNSSSSRGGSARPSSGRGGSSSRGSSSGSGRPSSGGRAGGPSRSSSGRPSSGSGRPSSGGRAGGSRSSDSRSDRPSRPYSDRPSSGRPSSGRSAASGERRAPRVVRDGEERSSRSYSDRPSSGGRAGGSRTDRPSRPYSDRPSSGRPSSGRTSRDGDSRSDRPSRSFGDRPSAGRPRRDDAPRGERRSSDRSYGDRPVGDRESRPRREWSRDERPKASDDRRSGGRPSSDRPRRDDRRDDRRPVRGSDRGGFGDRPRGGRPDRAGGRFNDREERPRAPRGEKRVNVQDPIIPDHITGNELPRNVRNELRTLPDGLALRVARHLAASGAFMDSDPELAWQHAKAALNKASRVGIIREAAAEAAYNAGHFAEALTEFRAARRMRGIKEYWPLMADCERALGRPEKAIAMAGDPLVASLDRASRVEMRIVAAGARVDQKKLDAALATLQCPELTTTSTEPWAARIRYAYADILAKLDRNDEAIEWFHRAAAVDMDQQTDADDRVAELEGRPTSDYDYEDFEDEVFEDWEEED